VHPCQQFQALAGGNLGIGALAIVQWVVGTSNGGNPAYSKPIVLVLDPLIAPTQEGHNIGYNLDELGLSSFQHPAQLLGKVWSSKHLYPLISPMFQDTHL